jgi:hypothetical protein
MKRRYFLAATSATGTSLLGGCATATGSNILGGIENSLKDSAMRLLNQAISDQIYLALGIRNRSAFVAGRPMSEIEKQGAIKARELFKEVNALPTETPNSLDIFDFNAQAVASKGLKVSNRHPEAWDGLTATGERQLARARASLERHRGKSTLSFRDVDDILRAHRPFLIAERLVSEYEENPALTQRVIVPAGTTVEIPLRTACLGAGLPLPRAGEGTRLVRVGAAVAPEHRSTVYALLAYSRLNKDVQLECQYLIWALVHADNNSYNKLPFKVTRPRQREILDTAVPGGHSHYQGLLDAAWARREEEAKKLRSANIALAQLKDIAGVSFELRPPSGMEVGGRNYTEDLLRQGFNHGTDELIRLANNQIDRAIKSTLAEAFRSLNQDIGGLGNRGGQILTGAAHEALDKLTPELTKTLLGSNRSPFEPLSGYTQLTPHVAAHVSDIGGTAGKAQLSLVNNGSTPFDFNPIELGAITPRRVQAQALWPDYAKFSESLLGQKPPYTSPERQLLSDVLKTFKGFFQTAVVKGTDVMRDKELNSLLIDAGVPTKNRIALLRLAPGLGTGIAVSDIVSYLYTNARNRINGTNIEPTNAFGEKMDWADLVLSMASLVPAGAGAIRGIDALHPFLSHGSRATLSAIQKHTQGIDWIGPLKSALTADPFMEAVRIYAEEAPYFHPSYLYSMDQGIEILQNYADPFGASMMSELKIVVSQIKLSP